MLTLLGVPTSAGAFAPGQEKAPAALREAGLVQALSDRGLEVRDLGDRAVWRWRPDREHLRAQNAAVVAEIARDTARRVEAALGDGGGPLLVLGGDCSIELGVIAGHGESVGLVYLDLHPDLNTPESVIEGTFDWMGMAHALALDGADAEVVAAAPRTPLLRDDQVVFLGYGPREARPFELDVMVRRGLAGVPADELTRDPEAAAARALEALPSGAERVLVHFDVDVIDFNDAQLSEEAVRGDGISLDAAMRALAVLARSDRLSAITITELNPEHGDEQGEELRRFVDRLAGALAA
jgi:arginase